MRQQENDQSCLSWGGGHAIHSMLAEGTSTVPNTVARNDTDFNQRTSAASAMHILRSLSSEPRCRTAGR